MEVIASPVFEWTAALEASVSRYFLGKPETVRLALSGLLMRGHLLLEDVPGVGKTLLAKAIAGSVGATFGRIQFTADLLPADVTGSSIYDTSVRQFSFKRGPLFVQVLLADELNRASPRTQSSLLEAMNEAQVTVDGVTHPLPDPFWVIATQNPVEHEGTYPLPASQLDRFALSLKTGYPSPEWETEILRAHMAGQFTVQDAEPVISLEQLKSLMQAVAKVHVDPSITEYVVRLAAETRGGKSFRMGTSPRGAILLHRAAMALALMEGREFTVPDDVKRMAVPALAHRVVLSEEAQAMGLSASVAIEGILQEVPVPL